MNGRRVKIIRINRDVLTDLLRMDGSRSVKIDGLPADARIVGVSDNTYFDYDEIALKVESDEFPELPSGHCIERLQLSVSEIRSDLIERDKIVAYLRYSGLHDTADAIADGVHHVPTVSEDGGILLPAHLTKPIEFLLSQDDFLSIGISVPGPTVADLKKQWDDIKRNSAAADLVGKALTSEEANDPNFGKEVEGEPKQEEKPVRFREFL